MKDRENRAVQRLFEPAPASALAVAAALAIIYPLVTPGDISSHMLLHIVLMSVIAPLIATALSLTTHREANSLDMWVATVIQIALLWLWHLPAVHHLAMSSTGGFALMQASLLTAAVWFWMCLIGLRGGHRWQGILALLITGKLACLLAGLLVFAPRPVLGGHHGMAASLDDQHLAGLLMLIACPASYVLAGVLMSAQLIGVYRNSSSSSVR